MRSDGAGWWVAGIAVGIVTAVAAAVALGTYANGFRYGGNSPVLVVLLTVAVLVTAGSAGTLLRRGDRVVGLWVAGLGGSAFGYLALTAASAEYAWAGGRRDALAQLLVAGHAAGYVLPMALTASCLLAGAVRLGASGAVVRRLPGVVAVYAAGFAALTVVVLPVGDPYGWVDPLWSSPAGQAVAGYLAVPWMLSIVAGPVVLWWWLPRVPPRSRQRMLTLAVISVVPVVTILFCVLSGLLAYAFGVLTVTAGEIGLAAAFGIPLVVCPAGLAAAIGPGGRGWQRRVTPTAVGAVLTVVVGLCFAIVVVSVGAMLGAQFGPGALVPAVAATAAVAAALGPVRRRLVRALLLRADPVRARAARLVRLHAGGSHPAETAQEILREALADPGARLLLRLPDGAGWVTADGGPAEQPPGDALAIAGADGTPHAYLLHGGAAEDAVGAVAEAYPMIDRAVLEAAIRDQAARLAAERERVREAAAGERRRLERDLHDGVQGRLLALALDLRMAQRSLDDGPAQLVLADATDALSAAIDELRALASGNTPELLSREGLGAALVELTRRIPVPITLAVPPDRLPPAVETVAYLAVCEAVTNALKHAGAGAMAITVDVSPGHAVVRVEDDGRGGADIRLGTGLRGLSERVGAAGGRLLVGDRDPRGTMLEVILPCA